MIDWGDVEKKAEWYMGLDGEGQVRHASEAWAHALYDAMVVESEANQYTDRYAEWLRDEIDIVRRRVNALLSLEDTVAAGRAERRHLCERVTALETGPDDEEAEHTSLEDICNQLSFSGDHTSVGNLMEWAGRCGIDMQMREQPNEVDMGHAQARTTSPECLGETGPEKDWAGFDPSEEYSDSASVRPVRTLSDELWPAFWMGTLYAGMCECIPEEQRHRASWRVHSINGTPRAVSWQYTPLEEDDGQ